jgi:hypothetical protein
MGTPSITFTSMAKARQKITFSFFFWCESVAHITALDGRGCAMRKGTAGDDTCYRVNNKNIKRATNPKRRGNEEIVQSEGRTGKKKKKRREQRMKRISILRVEMSRAVKEGSAVSRARVSALSMYV